MKAFLTAAIAAGVMSISTAAFAVTTTSIEPDLIVGESRPVGGMVSPGNTLEFKFTASEALKILDFFAFTANGSSGGNDTALATFSYNGDGGASSTGIPAGNTVSFGSQGISFAGLPGFVLAKGESFSLFLKSGDGASKLVDLDATFSTAAVPVPAAGLLLLTALAGGAAVARRKKKA
jgi:hypothetical protein